MRIIVGGQVRKVGKTTAVCRILRGFPDVVWTALKISGHGHGLAERAWALDEEAESGSSCDTARYLDAGATSALWFRGDVEAGRIAIESALIRSRHWIVESTRAAAWLERDLAILIVGPAAADPKESASGFAADLRIGANDIHLIEAVAMRWKP